MDDSIDVSSNEKEITNNALDAACNQMQHELPEKQCQAIEMLVSGQNIPCIAESLEISRETLWRWRQLPQFQATYAQRQTMVRAQLSDQMMEIMRLSLTSLERSLVSADNPKHPNPLGTALQGLRLMQPAQVLAPNESRMRCRNHRI